MSKKTKKPKGPAKPLLSGLAMRLLGDMAAQPNKLEYNTRVLGGVFRDADVELLDDAYAELLGARLVEPTGMVVSFFGVPKSVYRVSAAGHRFVKGEAA